MRVVSYAAESGWRTGVVLDGARVVDAAEAAARAGLGGAELTSMRALIAEPRERLAALEQAAAEHAEVLAQPLPGLRLGPPVPDPEKIVCIGLNYRDHAEEAGLPIPDCPVLFPKYRNTLIGHREPVRMLPVSDEYDYEAELAVVIGRTATAVSRADALDHVAGYMPFNDVSARDVQMRTSQWTAGKTLDTTGPCGPVLVLADEVPDPQALAIRARLNGQVVQDGHTRDMVFSVAELIEFVSSLITLVPGDVIATGTPAGVGFKRQPPIYLRDGDLLETEIEGLGTLETPVTAGAAA